jgi:hypothetical protein
MGQTASTVRAYHDYIRLHVLRLMHNRGGRLTFFSAFFPGDFF